MSPEGLNVPEPFWNMFKPAQGRARHCWPIPWASAPSAPRNGIQFTAGNGCEGPQPSRNRWRKRLSGKDNASPTRTALPAAHFERNDVTIICETVR
jgi:hypothetical protein